MNLLTLTVDPAYAAVEDTLIRLEDFVDGQGLTQQQAFKISLCVTEILNNILEHTLSSPAELGGLKEPIMLECLSMDHFFGIKVQHRAAQYRMPTHHIDDLLATSGRGLIIVKRILDQFSYSHSQGVNVVLMLFKVVH